jgi:hypothetical protein
MRGDVWIVIWRSPLGGDLAAFIPEAYEAHAHTRGLRFLQWHVRCRPLLISLQAWRGVPSHFNLETPLDAAIARVLAFGGFAGCLRGLLHDHFISPSCFDRSPGRPAEPAGITSDRSDDDSAGREIGACQQSPSCLCLERVA